MLFTILSEREIKDFKVGFKHIVISVRSPKTKKAVLPKWHSRVDTLFLNFHDLNNRSEALKGIRLFTKNDANKILKYFNKYKDKVELVVCQCEAGISRSSAIAAALCVYVGQNDDEKEIFKKYLPNSLVYNTILNVAFTKNKE